MVEYSDDRIGKKRDSVGTQGNDIQTHYKDSESWWKSLPFPLENVTVFEVHRPKGFRFKNSSYNISAEVLGRELLVSGEGSTKEQAVTKAVAELVERSTLIEFADANPDVKTSNGWAAYFDLEIAKINAIRELVERDSILRHWYSKAPFEVVDTDSLPQAIKSWVATELASSEFPQLEILISSIGLGPTATAILKNNFGFGVIGHCSRENIEESIEGAIEEACRMAHHFLLKSYLDDCKAMSLQISKKVNPGSHGVFYAHQEAFPSWLFGRTIDFNFAKDCWIKRNETLNKNFGKFQTKVVRKEPLFVVQATSEVTLDLNWGFESSESLDMRLNGKIPRVLRPTDGFNLKPHIVP